MPSFFMLILSRWCRKAYTNNGTFNKWMSIHYGTVFQSFFYGFKKYTFWYWTM